MGIALTEQIKKQSAQTIRLPDGLKGHSCEDCDGHSGWGMPDHSCPAGWHKGSSMPTTMENGIPFGCWRPRPAPPTPPIVRCDGCENWEENIEFCHHLSITARRDFGCLAGVKREPPLTQR